MDELGNLKEKLDIEIDKVNFLYRSIVALMEVVNKYLKVLPTDFLEEFTAELAAIYMKWKLIKLKEGKINVEEENQEN